MLATLLVLNYAKHRYKVFALGKENRGLKRFLFKHNLTCKYILRYICFLPSPLRPRTAPAIAHPRTPGHRS